MDGKGPSRYAGVTMRLLLLLSALLSALTGVVGGRAVAQPAPTSIAAPLAAVRALAPRPALLGLPAEPVTRLPIPAAPRLVGAVVARVLYAERRRE